LVTSGGPAISGAATSSQAAATNDRKIARFAMIRSHRSLHRIDELPQRSLIVLVRQIPMFGASGNRRADASGHHSLKLRDTR